MYRHVHIMHIISADVFREGRALHAGIYTIFLHIYIYINKKIFIYI